MISLKSLLSSISLACSPLRCQNPLPYPLNSENAECSLYIPLLIKNFLLLSRAGHYLATAHIFSLSLPQYARSVHSILLFH